jgi:predicted acyltransferase
MHATATLPTPAAGARLVSLDVFRGATVGLMIVVNCCGEGSFRQLLHSEWNGWTLTDLVFPFFLFITGVALTFSFSGRLRRGKTRLSLLPHILRRGVILFAFGLLINAFPHFHLATLRIPGVLQRIALCYLVAAVLYLWTGTRTRWAIAAACLLSYWLLMRFVPVPGFGVPTESVPMLDPDRNLAAWLDRLLMSGHLYEVMRDPEGLLSTLPALGNVLAGVAVGEWLRELRSQPQRLLRRLALCGAACFLAGELWGLSFPINKKLWTSSYVLLTVGLAMLALALCYWLLDVRKFGGRGTVVPLVFGTNTIFAYAFSEFVAISWVAFHFQFGGEEMTTKDLLCTLVFEKIPSPAWSQLSYALFYAAFCWFATWLLYRKKIFLKI